MSTTRVAQTRSQIGRFFNGTLFNVLTFCVALTAIVVSLYGIRRSDQASKQANRLSAAGNAIAASGGTSKPEILDGTVDSLISVYACEETAGVRSTLVLRYLAGGRILLANNGGKAVSVVEVGFFIDGKEFGETTVVQPHGPQTILQPIPIPIPIALGVGEGRWVEIVSRLRNAITGPKDLDAARRLQGPATFEITLKLSDGSVLTKRTNDGYYSKSALEYTISSPSSCD